MFKKIFFAKGERSRGKMHEPRLGYCFNASMGAKNIWEIVSLQVAAHLLKDV